MQDGADTWDPPAGRIVDSFLVAHDLSTWFPERWSRWEDIEKRRAQGRGSAHVDSRW